MPPVVSLHPSALPPGTQVGSWQVRGRVGEGTYGTVYRVIGAGASEERPLALKLASHPEDSRFEREAELLRRILHPGIPRLHDQGMWAGHEGLIFPYFVMEWVEGVPLYDWARARPPTSRGVLRVLAQVARALEATHAAGCLHRDVKGDNVLVDGAGRAVLVDFGSGSYAGARSLTREIFPPDTPPYRSPQALRFQYPPAAVDLSLEREEAHGAGEPLVPPGRLATVCPQLEALILRMLADSPEVRGTATEVAEALEAVAERAGPEADGPIVPRSSDVPTESKAWPEPRRRWRWGRVASWLTAAAVGALLATTVGWWSERWHWLQGTWVVEEDTSTGLGDTTLGAPDSPAMPELDRKGIKLEVPKQPLPGQRRPPCPPKQVEILGGCWFKVDAGGPPCGADAYEWKGACFSPAVPPGRPTTSEEP